MELARVMHDTLQTTHALTVLKCVTALLEFYMCMTIDPFRPDIADSSCQTCCTFYAALSTEAARKHGHGTFWRVKPKFHMFCELAQYQCFHLGNPSMHWNYADEDFVGWVATLAESTGGAKQAGTTSRNVLDKYRILTDL